MSLSIIYCKVVSSTETTSRLTKGTETIYDDTFFPFYRSQLNLSKHSINWSQGIKVIYVCLFVWWCLTPLSIIFQLYRGTDCIGSCKSNWHTVPDLPLCLGVLKHRASLARGGEGSSSCQRDNIKINKRYRDNLWWHIFPFLPFPFKNKQLPNCRNTYIPDRSLWH
jgi:hypothetical protein